MTKGKLIVLNGGSSAGKTSLGSALQDALLPETYLLLGIDVFWMALPPKELDLDRVAADYYSWHMETHQHKKHFVIEPGPILDRVMHARYLATAAYLECGLNIIADEVLWKRAWHVLPSYAPSFRSLFIMNARWCISCSIR